MVSCPTTAITFKPVAKVKVSTLSSSSEVLPARDLLADPIFTGIPPKFLLWQQGLVVRRRFRAGETLCRQGDPGNTAFLIKSGKLQVKVYPPAPPPTDRFSAPLFRTSRPSPLLQVELTPANLIFGEMACLSALPRSADVVALEAGEVWELRRNVLDRLMRLPSQRRELKSNTASARSISSCARPVCSRTSAGRISEDRRLPPPAHHLRARQSGPDDLPPGRPRQRFLHHPHGPHPGQRGALRQ
jgi:hypothetical protein